MRFRLVQTLTETDVKNSFQIPPEWMPIAPESVGQGQTQLCVTDESGFFWEFWCVKTHESNQPAETAKSQAHFESEGWLRFVNFKGLKAGDRVVIDVVENKFRGTKLRLRAQNVLDDDEDDNDGR
ncbi:B3 DNA binding domain containing protein [Trema orientale]|uniref:B3 DNA binding domain containing protein n=1 Tax=Trema orientale TaxID=63057 RepID=A0A2P5G020_TREOI|nr:B3 DNA binding domain containing protein [Trema orientale]